MHSGISLALAEATGPPEAGWNQQGPPGGRAVIQDRVKEG